MNIKDLGQDYKIVSSPDNPTNIKDLGGDYTVQQNQFGVLPKPQMPILTGANQGANSGFGTALKDVAVGAGKDLIDTARGTAGLLQTGGKMALGAMGVDTSKMGIKSIDNSTPEGAGVADTLASKSRGEQTGKVLSTVGQLGAGFITGGGEAKVKQGYDALKASQEARVVNQEAKATEKVTSKAFESITPKTTELTPTEYQDLLGKQKITPKTATSPAQYILSDSEKQTAIKYKDLLQAKDPVKNSINVIDKISSTDKEVGNFLRQNNGTFNNGELKNYILDKLKGVSDVTVPESRINKLKQTMVDNFTKILPKNDMESLWTARKTYDRAIESAFNGSPSLQNTVKREFRNAIQDYIAERTPDGVYKQSMKDMRELFNLQDTIATKASKEKSLNQIQLWLKNNPTKAKVIGLGTGAAGLDFIYNTLKH